MAYRKYEQTEKQYGADMGEILDGFYAQGLTDEQVAERLKIKRKTVWQWKKRAGRKTVRRFERIEQ